MAKRTADKELTHDNWDQEQEDEEAGIFRSATKEVLETREIKKAKRRGVTDDKGSAGAFKGFSFGVATSTAGGFVSKPLAAAMQANSESKPVFGGFKIDSVSVEASKSGNPKPSSGDADTESQYRHSLRTLNESVLSWINDHIKTNPYCILTPVFNDYEKYIKELDRDFPQSSDKVVGGLFSFCTAAGNSDGKPLALPASTTAGTTGFTAPSLRFGAPDSKAITGFGFVPAPSIGATSANLTFGAQSPKVTTSPISGFSFGAQPSKDPVTLSAPAAANPVMSGFNFGAPPPKDSVNLLPTSAAANPLLSGFNFGAPPPKDPVTLPTLTAANLMSGFNFGASPTAVHYSGSGYGLGRQLSKDLVSVASSTAANCSEYGSACDAQQSKDPVTFASATAAKTLKSGFGFGTHASKEATATPASGFRFNIQPGVEATSSVATIASDGASTSAQKDGGEDEAYVPPKPDVVDIKEDGAFYTVRCKLYYNVNNEFKDRGVGNLYLKPCGDKTQLLVRAGTTLGNILLNILLNKSIPTSRQGNNVTMVCVPNPPLDDKKPDDKTPVCMLLRVKKESDAETLLKQINDHKA